MRASIILAPLIVLVVIGVIYTSVSGRNQLPGYAGDDPTLDLVSDAKAARTRLAQTFEGVTRRGADLSFTDRELRDVVLVGLSRHAEGQRILELSTGLSTKLQDGKLAVGVKIDFSKVLGSLSEDERKMFDKAVGLAPLLENKEVLMAFETTPSLERGRLAMDLEDTAANVSVVKMPLSTWIERLGKNKRKAGELFKFKIPGYQLGNMSVDGNQMRVNVRRT